MSTRKNIYYWKSDRPSALKYLNNNNQEEYTREMASQLQQVLSEIIPSKDWELSPANGQGNHLTFVAKNSQSTYFLRLENGMEEDDYMLVESEVMKRVRDCGVPVPKIFHVNTGRQEVPFSYQVMELIDFPDLNKWKKSGLLNPFDVAGEIGKNVAKWQKIETRGFGPFDPKNLINSGSLHGFHDAYIDYYYLNLEQHLNFLRTHDFLTASQVEEIGSTINTNKRFLELEQSCLVHKDLALWNLLGKADEVKAVIDWDDAIAGDPTDDLSLMACFHPEEVLEEMIRGYTGIKELPKNFYPRFYLHLLRNMIVKAVIRVGGDYFEKGEDFFLVDSEIKGRSMVEFTQSRIMLACEKLRKKVNRIQL